MGVLNFFKRKKESRATWIPWQSSRSDTKATYLAGNLSQLRRCLALYRDLLVSTPLVAFRKGQKIDHPLLKVINKPAKYMTRYEFYTRLTESYWLEGNFYAYIDRLPNQKIKALLPFTNGTIYAYSTGKNNADPIRLETEKDSYHYISQFEEGKGDNKKIISAKYLPEDILHLKSQWQSSDLLNGVSLYKAYVQTIDLAQDTLETAQKYAQNGMIGPHVVSGIQDMPATQKTELSKELNKFFNDKGQFLTLDDKVKLDQSIVNNPAVFMQILGSISTLHLSRLMSVPVSLLAREDGASTDVGVSLKESHRFFIRTSGRAWLQMIAEKLNELVTDGTTFKYQWRSNQLGDLREAQVISPLIQDGIITKDQAREWVVD